MKATPTILIPLCLALAAPVLAQESAPSFDIELNALQPSDNGCRVTFVVTNSLGVAVDLVTAELALFNVDRAIERIVKLDFKDLGVGKSKVLQFNVPSLDCTRIGRLLINDITACQGETVAVTACLENLRTSTVPDLKFGI
jgi:hypothetical protein